MTPAPALTPSPSPIQDALQRVQALSPAERAALERAVTENPALALWAPLPGPQTRAFFSTADELFYGGAASGGKSALVVGLALLSHRRTLIIRRESTQLRGIVDEIASILGTRDGLNRQEGVWRIPESRALYPGQTIEFGGVPNPGDEERHQGIPHDLLAFDEATQLPEYVIDYLSTWNRTSTPEQRCRIILTSNPPTPSTQYSSGRSSQGGAWIVRRYAPWLDPDYARSNPLGLPKAAPGELRYYVTLDGREQEWPDPLPFEHKDSRTGRPEIVTPKSRTFIQALPTDNPFTGPAYLATLQKLPEPLRSALLYGDFAVSLSDRPLQLIPSDWVRQAQARHRATPAQGAPGYPPSVSPMTALGADIARGGVDSTVLCARYGPWFAPFEILAREQTADGPGAAAAIFRRLSTATAATAIAVIDANGVGASAYDALRALVDPSRVRAHVGSEGTDARDESGMLGFVNRRSAVYWALREALDPKHARGYALALPDDPELTEELLTLTYEEVSGRIKVMPKKDHARLIGRSPDKADALTLAFSVRDEDSPDALDATERRAERVRAGLASQGRDPLSRRSPTGARWSDKTLPYPTRW